LGALLGAVDELLLFEEELPDFFTVPEGLMVIFSRLPEEELLVDLGLGASLTGSGAGGGGGASWLPPPNMRFKNPEPGTELTSAQAGVMDATASNRNSQRAAEEAEGMGNFDISGEKETRPGRQRDSESTRPGASGKAQSTMERFSGQMAGIAHP